MLEAVKKQPNIVSFSLITEGTVIMLGLKLNEFRRFNEEIANALLSVTEGIEKKLREEKI